MRRTSLMVVTGELSGDIHAANLLRALNELRPGLETFGVGGDELQSAGLECLFRAEDLAHMGLVEVLRELPRIRNIMHALVAAAQARRPALAVLVDSPDFNLRLAKHLHQLGIAVVLFISPQLWAWRQGRVNQVRRVAKEVLCILPFEVDFYLESGVKARYVGHPLVDELHRQGLLEMEAPPQSGRLALLPGSRRMEVEKLLPVMLRGLAHMPAELVAEAVLIEAPGVSEAVDRILDHGGSPDPRLRRVRGPQRRHELAVSCLAWTASGTATLECALLQVPMIVGYRLNALSYAIAKRLVRVPHVSLVNLIARRGLVPELLQGAWNPARLVKESEGILTHSDRLQRAGLLRVRERLGEAGASRRAAEAILEHLI